MTDLRTTFLDYDARRNPKTDFFCVACQKDMDQLKPVRAVHLIAGGYTVLHPDDELQYEPDGGDMGCWPIGECCAKKLGLEWTHAKSLWPRRVA